MPTERNIYMDDLYKAAPTLAEATILTKDLQILFSRGGFNLTKWTSDSEDFLWAHQQERHRRQRQPHISWTISRKSSRGRMEARQRRTSCGSQKNQSIDKNDLTQRLEYCLEYWTIVGQIPQRRHFEGSQRMD